LTPFDAKDIVDRLAAVLPAETPLHEPEFRGNEWAYVKECLDTGWVSSVGKYVDRFEEMLSDFTGVRHAVATVNGTAALHAALVLAGVEADDEVVVPALTFVATANAVTYCGAVPHLADSEERTLGLDPAKLSAHLEEIAQIHDGRCVNRQTGRRLRAVVCMHTFGHPVDLDPLVEVCDRFHLTLIEDAAESIGSYYKGRHTGAWGRLSILSFNGNKTITTGGGGAILTDDEKLAARAKHVTTTAKPPHRWQYAHDTIGYNYRLPNINAALGCAQLEQLPDLLERKRRLAGVYETVFADVEGVRFFTEPAFARGNYWLNVLLTDAADQRDALLAESNDRGIMTRPAWTPMHHLPMFTDCPRMDLGVADDLFARIVNIPSSARLVPEPHESA
jgi:perosamine synthetase